MWQAAQYVINNLLLEILLRVIFLGVVCICQLKVQPHARQVTEAELLHDYKRPRHDSYVPAWVTVFLIVFVPLFCICIPFMWTRNYVDTVQALLAWTLALTINAVMTESVKLIVGRPRPDFFWRCFPDGQMTSELQCTGDVNDVVEGRKSFPSGHSSFSFCSLGFLSFWFCGKVGVLSRNRGQSCDVILCLAPLMVATVVAVSRVCDNHHHWEDVLVGSLLGFSTSYFCYLQYYHPLWSQSSGEPYEFEKSHRPWYRYRCSEMSEEVFDTGFDKQLFKQGVARRLLEQLSLRGYDVPPHLSSPSALNELMDLVGLPTYSFVVLVSELCREYRLDPVEYEVLADPAGQPSITVKARIGYVERVATAASKRIAHQLAAGQIYKHLRTMLRGTRDFNEEEAMFRAYTRTMRQIGDEQGACLGEQRRKKMEQQVAAKAEKNTQSLAIQATVLMELDQSEHSDQPSYEVVSALPPHGTPNAPEQDSNKAQTPDEEVHQAAVQLLQLTMERLGI